MTTRPINLKDWQVRAIAEDRLGLIVMPRDKWPRGRGITRLPPFDDGDLLWCRETWGRTATFVPCPIYKADGATIGTLDGWHSPVTMPKWASRTTLRVLRVDVKRVQDITEEEARLAGATFRPNCCGLLRGDDGWSMDWSRVGEMSQWAMKPPGPPRYTPLRESDIALCDPQMAFASAHPTIWDENPWCAFGRVEVINKNVEDVK